MSDRGRTGTLYIVATPIGNPEDITARAVNVLRGVATVAAEDTRRARVLLANIGAAPRQLLSLANHNESARSTQVLARLRAGEDVALVSDAGTPLISDPGFELVRAARAAGVLVVPTPGVSALTAALSVCPIPVDRFRFEGFLPAKAAQRQRRLRQLADAEISLVCFETARRLEACLGDVAAEMGDRQIFLAKEISKQHERYLTGAATELRAAVIADAELALGEYVLVIAADSGDVATLNEGARALVRILCEELPPSQAARIAARSLGVPKAAAYEFALSLRASPPP
jgi:16S rRNA (cytidine1402-2'-O)-methyltransferase